MTVTTPPPSDAWLDDLALHPQQRASSGPIRAARRLADFVITTPGKMLAMMLVLTVAVGAIGFAQSQSMSKRQHALDVLVQTTEPMNHSAHVLLTSLSQADTVATTGFVQAGLMTPDEVKAYLASIDQAVIAASDIYEGASELTRPEDQERIQNLVRSIQRDLPLYVAFMERAKVNQRLGNPVGVSYMSEASGMMRERMITSANTLFALTQRQVAVEMVRLNAPQWVPLSGLVAALLLLAGAQWWLWRLTRRRFNRGFVAATGLLFLALVWASASNFATWASGHQGFETVSRPWDSLTASRIEAQQMRTSETLALVLRSSEQDMSVHFSSTVYSVDQALRDYEQALSDDDFPSSDPSLIPRAKQAVEDWTSTHEKFTEDLAMGDYDAALYQATAIDPDGDPTAASAFNAVDSSLAALIDQARDAMRTYLVQGLNAMTMVSTGVLLATFGAIIAVWLGIRPRLQEYL